MAEPQFLMAHCLTEPQGASDRWLPYNVPEVNMDTRAVLADGDWVINGRKQFISNGYDARSTSSTPTPTIGGHAPGHLELPGPARHTGPAR